MMDSLVTLKYTTKEDKKFGTVETTISFNITDASVAENILNEAARVFWTVKRVHRMRVIVYEDNGDLEIWEWARHARSK